jgi:hypothetical protein
MKMLAGGAMSVGLVAWLTEWVHLSWIRTVIDGLMALFFLVAAAKTGVLEGGEKHWVTALHLSAAEPVPAAGSGRVVMNSEANARRGAADHGVVR